MNKHIYSVKTLVGEIRALLEDNYREIWVEGEISGLGQPASGHKYFSLKEGDALIRCALFKNRRQHQPTTAPAEGMQALVRGRLSVYESRGDMQLIVDYLEDAGEGALRREFEQLKRKLSAEGLFDDQHKQLLPKYPKVIGIISSDSGAALHDIRVTMERRYPLARLIVYPTAVQGVNAVPGIIDMLALANQRREVDLLILSRGGGAPEDLKSFNDESVARAIFASKLPVVSAVGHEIDFTIADLVADVRAPTPTAAAEMVAPEISQLHQKINQNINEMQQIIQRIIDHMSQRHDYAGARLAHPMHRINAARQTHTALTETLGHLVLRHLDQQQLRMQKPIAELRYHSPLQRLAHHVRRVRGLCRQLIGITGNSLNATTQTIEHLTNNLDLMNPKRTLERGYAILQKENQQVVFDADKTKPGETLTASVAHGKFLCVVDRVVK